MIIKGHVVSNVNIRSTPNSASTTNVVGTIFTGQNFIGSGYIKDTTGKDWITLSKVNGVDKVGYIASYIAAVVVDETISDTPMPVEDLGIPEKVTTIEEFKLSDGSTKRRVIEWNNPQVIEQ